MHNHHLESQKSGGSILPSHFLWDSRFSRGTWYLNRTLKSFHTRPTSAGTPLLSPPLPSPMESLATTSTADTQDSWSSAFSGGSISTANGPTASTYCWLLSSSWCCYQRECTTQSMWLQLWFLLFGWGCIFQSMWFTSISFGRALSFP